MYEQLLKMNGQKCYTLDHQKEADMDVDQRGVTIIYPSGRERRISREMIEDAISLLKQQGNLAIEEVDEIITRRDRKHSVVSVRIRTVRLMAILGMLPGVTHTVRPLRLYFKG